MPLNYYYIENGREIPANLNDLKVDCINPVSEVQDNHSLVTKCNLNYDNRAIIIGMQAPTQKIKFVKAAAQFGEEQLPANHIKTPLDTHIFVSVPFDKTFIDFFSLSENKLFLITIETAGVSERTSRASTFKVKIPFVKQTELPFRAPRSEPPSKLTRGVCVQEFKMTESSAEEEISLCILLEEFKILPIAERYRVQGYVKMLSLFLEIENSFEMNLLEKLSLNSVQPTSTKGRNKHYKIATGGEVPALATFVELTPMEVYLDASLPPSVVVASKIQAVIKAFFPKHIEVMMLKQKTEDAGAKFDESKQYRLEYLPNFFSSGMAKRAIDHIQKHDFESYMLNFTLDPPAPAESSLKLTANWFIDIFKSTKKSLARKEELKKFEDASFKWLNEQISTNQPQMKAVKSIVNRTNFPSPFIVFGGPGCGKTSLAVEAIAQIVKLMPKAKILVTTNSNSACDELGDRLLNYIGPNRLYRFYSPSLIRRLNKVSSDLVPYSNLRNGEHKQPSYEEIMSYNVVISTLVNSGRLSFIPSQHFDFIFVDECASVNEAFVNIPIALAVNRNVAFSASIVLLGDPKQLGQITRTFHTERYGFSVSMMERVMCLDRYKFDEHAGYDAKYIVQLTDNFRSHKSIINYSNGEFYNSKLVSCQKQEIANFAIGWTHLPNKEYPVIFHSSWTPSQEDGTSLYNNGDLFLTKKYVNRLLHEGINGKKVSPGDIGIISPYAAQREKLKAMFANSIEIGTVEYFQGREKLIIILSCVRSKTKTIGFLRNEKRLNVALTRAKALMIVIGNPETLGQNKYWRKFITLCKLKKAIVGKVPSWVIKKTKLEMHFEEDEDDVVRLEELMNAMMLQE